jgi:2-dehydropantoate 2-reductase
LLAGYLHRCGTKLTLVHHRPERIEILKRGIQWEGIETSFTFSAPVVLGLAEPHQIDLVVICVKAYDTDGVARELSAAGFSGAVMTLQNGVDNAEIIRKHLPDSPVFAGVTSQGAHLIDLNHVRHAGKGKTVFGRVDSNRPDDGFETKILNLFRAAQLDAEIVSDPVAAIWGKALLNAGINGLTAILGVRNGLLLEIEPARELMARLVTEAWEVLKAKEMSQKVADPVSRIEEVCRMTADNYSSMYMDVKQHRRTEIDFINGAIVREAKKFNIPCPNNEAITKIVRALEQKALSI